MLHVNGVQGPHGSNESGRVHAHALRRFVVAVMRALAVRRGAAGAVADVLVTADLRGIDSHGVARLERFYVEPVVNGIVDGKAKPRVLVETRATLVVDAANGLGHPVSSFAMRRALEKARAHGLGIATVRNSNHHGATSHYALAAARAGMMGIAATNTPRVTVPTFGPQKILGSNPLAVAIPGRGEDRFVLDVATSAVAYGKIELAARDGQTLQDGIAVDAAGRPTHDADAALAGALLPLGGLGTERGGHKGFGLSVLLEILTGVLAGGAFGEAIPDVAGMPYKPAAASHLFVAIDPGRVRESRFFRRDVSALLDDVRASAPDAGHDCVRVPGDALRKTERERRVRGIPLPSGTLASLARVAIALGLEPPDQNEIVPVA